MIVNTTYLYIYILNWIINFGILIIIIKVNNMLIMIIYNCMVI